MIVFECPSCNKKLQAKDEHVGKSIACPGCKNVTKVPAQMDGEPTAITADSPSGSSAAPPATSVTTSEQVRNKKSDIDRPDDEDEPQRKRRRDRDDAQPKRGAGMGVGLILLIVGFVGCGIFGVLGILAALLVPAVQKVREAAERTQSMNNLKQIGLAAHNHHATNMHLPSPRNQPIPPIGFGMQAPDVSWRVTILPFIEQQPVWQQFDKNADWNHANNLPMLSMMPPMYYCINAGQALNSGEKDTFFQYFTGPNTLFTEPLRKVRFADIPDGTSNTILLAQANAKVPWTKAEDMVMPANGPLPLPNGPFLVLLADGSVRTIQRNRVTDATLRLLIDPRDGMPLPMNAFD